MTYSNIPRRSGLGRDANPRRPGLIDFDFTIQHGNRAQRREILRQLKSYARAGIPDADEELVRAASTIEKRAAQRWLVAPPGRAPFEVIVPQRATEHEILAQWPGAIVRALS